MSSLPKYHSLLLLGLAQGYASPDEMPLHSTKAQAGLFPSSALGKAAAKSAQDAGWLSTVRTETRGKSKIIYVTLTDQGTAYLLEQTDPKPLLEQVHHLLKTEEAHLQDVQSMVRNSFQMLQSLRERVEQLDAMVAEQQIVQTKVTVPAWEDRLTDYLSKRQSARPAEDCPLPELYREARCVVPDMTVGTFHDGLRRLQAQQRIALQPWTGPLHELPEPSLALLTGHSLAFYASAAGVHASACSPSYSTHETLNSRAG